jgi:hypothetical protein
MNDASKKDGGNFLLRPSGSGGKDVGVELDWDDPDEPEPTWAIHADVLLTTTELLAFADAIREQFGALASAEDVARALSTMRQQALAPRHYACACGTVIETTWPGRAVECPECDTRYHEIGDGADRVLRKVGGEDVVLVRQVAR